MKAYSMPSEKYSTGGLMLSRICARPAWPAYAYSGSHAGPAQCPSEPAFHIYTSEKWKKPRKIISFSIGRLAAACTPCGTVPNPSLPDFFVEKTLEP